ncbi:diguanylate cyclase [Azospirillum sp. SYSU D00513]|uniref:sensor domain-containing diguanylate cyclase n=1 Tax=Azospirillum sp. SYSU D00513 TaxID=2812561 RepID=UPI001A9725B2|nr:diguanylate cyclase [Azospirillum sp. SYSU D00513]
MSLRARILLLWSAAVSILLALCAVLFVNLEHAVEDAEWVERTKDIVLLISHIQSDVRDAETGQRGYLLTERSTYLAPYESAVSTTWGKFDRADALMTNPGQKARLAALQGLIREKLDELGETVRLGQEGKFAEARRLVLEDRGLVLMGRIRLLVGEIEAVQAELLETRRRNAAEQLQQVHNIVLFGGPLTAVCLALLGLTTARRIGRPLEGLLEGTRQLSAGRFEHRIPVVHNDELGLLAKSFNAMAESQAESLRARERADAALQRTNVELQSHGRSVELLGKMAQRLQSVTDEREFGAVVQQFVPRVLTGLPGALYAHNNSRNLLVRLAVWGGADAPAECEPDDCWAMRRGQPHVVTGHEPDIRCAHIGEDHAGHGAAGYACLPLSAGGDMIGLLHLEGELGDAQADVASALMENVALALMNHRLRARLREQSIRDPLTGLFNRRYMEEALALEFARVERTGEPVGIIMADIDHFKRFNDTFGHDAGDALLQAVGKLLHELFRNGDIACRYGGEELTVILPGSGMAALEARAEQLLRAVRELSLVHKGQPLGRITISLGLAIRPDHGATPAAVLAAADAALLRAKRGGRDRLERAPLLVAEPV